MPGNAARTTVCRCTLCGAVLCPPSDRSAHSMTFRHVFQSSVDAIGLSALLPIKTTSRARRRSWQFSPSKKDGRIEGNGFWRSRRFQGSFVGCSLRNRSRTSRSVLFSKESFRELRDADTCIANRLCNHILVLARCASLSCGLCLSVGVYHGINTLCVADTITTYLL
jgi:hypothetical protein